MYDELVTRLWECTSGECFNCSQYTPTTNASVCQKELMKQAADAIEELSRENESLAKTVQEASESLRQRRPVVLCRDCWRYFARSGTDSGYCALLDIGTSQEAFCSRGEREES